MTTSTLTKGKLLANDIVALLKARNPLIWIVTREEARVELFLFDAAAAAKYVPYTWDCGQGVANIGGDVQAGLGSSDIGETLTTIRDRSRAVLSPSDTNRAVWILRDPVKWLQDPTTNRQLRNLARSLPGVPKNTAQAIIVLSPSADIPAELAGDTIVIEWSLPDRVEIADIIDRAIRSLPAELQATAAPNGTRDSAIDAAVGLTGVEAQACYAKSLVQTRKIDPVTVAKEKRRVIARERVLEWFEPLAGGLDSVGGLDVLKTWLDSRKTAYSKKAREYGLPAPKGALLVGVPGCGKSLIAKAVATAWGVPLLRLDLGALKSKFVGDSEANIRKAFTVIESVGRCVVWLDEIEKALSGATEGAADGGVSSDALGAILSWMQEREGEAFIIATSNDVSKLPPELLRKGRFDEIFFVDLPTTIERVAILDATIKSFKRDPRALKIDSTVVALSADNFTGSEVAELVKDAMFVAFSDNREITTKDLVEACKTVVPLAKTAEKKITSLREWANGRARYATSKTEERIEVTNGGRDLDL